MSQFVKATTTDQVRPGNPVGVKVDGVFVGIYKVEEEYYALNNICPHLGGMLSYGFQDDNVVTCPLHMWEFDVKTGECVWPGQERLATYPVKVEGADILVDVNSPKYPEGQ
jgi:3-phenylpropionate/trans-cinnamate dioxygenase ferredoxin component